MDELKVYDCDGHKICIPMSLVEVYEKVCRTPLDEDTLYGYYLNGLWPDPKKMVTRVSERELSFRTYRSILRELETYMNW